MPSTSNSLVSLFPFFFLHLLLFPSPSLPLTIQSRSVSTTSNPAPHFQNCHIPPSPFTLRIPPLLPHPSFVPHTYYPTIPLLKLDHVLHQAILYAEDKIYIRGNGHDFLMDEHRDLPLVSWAQGVGVRVREAEWRPVTPPRERERPRPARDDSSNMRTEKREGRARRERRGLRVKQQWSNERRETSPITAQNILNTTINTTITPQPLPPLILNTSSNTNHHLTWSTISLIMHLLQHCVLHPSPHAQEEDFPAGPREMKAEVWYGNREERVAVVEIFRGRGSALEWVGRG